MNQWISMKDEPPARDVKVIFLASLKNDLLHTGDKIFYQNKQFIGFLEGRQLDEVSCVFGDGWVPFDVDDITHWMPLPELPK